MELVPVLRRLWGRRLVLVVGVLLAVATALVVGHGQPVRSGAATVRVVLDTPDSQVVYTAPGGADSLQWRTKLLAHLMASQPSKAMMARELGVAVARIAVDVVPLEVPEAPTTLPVAATGLASYSPEPYEIVVRFDERLPLISVAARGPDRTGATRLADSAVVVLQASATGRNDHRLQGFVVDRVGPTRSKEVSAGGGMVRALSAAAFVICVWIAGVVIFPGSLSVQYLRRRRTQRA
jgi:hypothetical protein